MLGFITALSSVIGRRQPSGRSGRSLPRTAHALETDDVRITARSEEAVSVIEVSSVELSRSHASPS